MTNAALGNAQLVRLAKIEEAVGVVKVLAFSREDQGDETLFMVSLFGGITVLGLVILAFQYFLGFIERCCVSSEASFHTNYIVY
jgi:hypothetical protein